MVRPGAYWMLPGSKIESKTYRLCGEVAIDGHFYCIIYTFLSGYGAVVWLTQFMGWIPLVVFPKVDSSGGLDSIGGVAIDGHFTI